SPRQGKLGGGRCFCGTRLASEDERYHDSDQNLATSSDRLWAPTFANSAETWTSTVLLEHERASAMALLPEPRESRASTSDCRGVRAQRRVASARRAETSPLRGLWTSNQWSASPLAANLVAR